MKSTEQSAISDKTNILLLPLAVLTLVLLSSGAAFVWLSDTSPALVAQGGLQASIHSQTFSPGAARSPLDHSDGIQIYLPIQAGGDLNQDNQRSQQNQEMIAPNDLLEGVQQAVRAAIVTQCQEASSDPNDPPCIQGMFFTPINAIPVVTISAPPNGATYTQGDSVTFTGTANDAEDGDLTANIDWDSNLDGDLGTDGGSFSTTSLSVGTHQVTASVTDSGGETGNASVTITVNSGSNQCGGLVQEAEGSDGTLYGAYVVANDNNASGSAYVHVPNGFGNRWSGPDMGQRASYCVTIPAAGNYRIEAVINAATGAENSMWVQVDGAPASGYVWFLEQGPNYVVNNVSGAGVGDPLILNLSAGDHTIDFFLREDGARLDKFEFVLDSTTAAASAQLAQATSTHESLILGHVHIDNLSDDTLEPRLTDSSISISNLETGTLIATVRPDRYGNYIVEELPLGKYAVRIETPAGYELVGPKTINVAVRSNLPGYTAFDLVAEVSDADGNNIQSQFDLYLPLIVPAR